MSVEVEIKLSLESAEHARRLLAQAGFVADHERSFEANTVFDTPQLSLLERKQLLRLREFRGRNILTFKGAPLAGPHKTRPEYETEVADREAFRHILAGLGYLPQFRYEKYRTMFSPGKGEGHACLDETPMGVFLELEGPGAWIDETAARLGFGPEQYITLSYGSLWREYCLKRGQTGTDMTFGNRES